MAARSGRLLPFFWMPKDRVHELERVCRVPYATWIEQGFIEATPGNAIDLRAVKRRIRWGRGAIRSARDAFRPMQLPDARRWSFSTKASRRSRSIRLTCI